MGPPAWGRAPPRGQSQGPRPPRRSRSPARPEHSSVGRGGTHGLDGRPEGFLCRVGRGGRPAGRLAGRTLTPNICRRSGSRKRKGMLETCSRLGSGLSAGSTGCRDRLSVCAASSVCCGDRLAVGTGSRRALPPQALRSGRTSRRHEPRPHPSCRRAVRGCLDQTGRCPRGTACQGQRLAGAEGWVSGCC